MHRRAVSENTSLTLMGLGIDFFPVHKSPTLPTPLSPPLNQVHHPGGQNFGDILSGPPTVSNSGRGITVGNQLASLVPLNLPVVSMRSRKGMRGLLDAEIGGSMVELDPYTSDPGGSGFRSGARIVGTATPCIEPKLTKRARAATFDGTSSTISRHPTILGHHASPNRNDVELKALLGTQGRKLAAGTIVPSYPLGRQSRSAMDKRKSASTSDLRRLAQQRSGEEATTPAIAPISLEKAKSKARVEVDLFLESETVVEGGYLKGKMEVFIRKAGKNEQPIWIGGGKLRVVGFEGIPSNDTRHTFYQFGQLLSEISASCQVLYASAPDEEGFCLAREGTHVLPFAMKLPINGPGGVPKGVWQSRSGVTVRYIAMGSIKLRDPLTNKRSFSHFYRQLEVFPYLDPSVVLAPLEWPLQSTNSRSLFLGGSGKVHVKGLLHRRTWIAGQRCYVRIAIANQSSKRVKTLTLSLIRSVTVFKPDPQLDASASENATMDDGKITIDFDACQTSTSRKVVAETILESGYKGEKGCVTAKGWWTGVEAGSSVEISHFLLLPPDSLTITRGRLLEVDYTIKVSAGAGSLSSDIHVSLPIHVINFLSIDPPPHIPEPESSIGATSKPFSWSALPNPGAPPARLANSRPALDLSSSTNTTGLNPLSVSALKAHNENALDQLLNPVQDQQARNPPPNRPMRQAEPGTISEYPSRPDPADAPQVSDRSCPAQQSHQPRSLPVRCSARPGIPFPNAPHSYAPESREHGKAIARVTQPTLRPTGDGTRSSRGLVPSKSVAFADHWTMISPVRQYSAPLATGDHPQQPPESPLFSVSDADDARQQIRLFDFPLPPSDLFSAFSLAAGHSYPPEPTPPEMRLTASAAADDEMTTESGYSNYDDEGDPGYVTDETEGVRRVMLTQEEMPIEVAAYAGAGRPPFDNRSIQPNERTAFEESESPVLASVARDGDMSGDSGWDADEWPRAWDEETSDIEVKVGGGQGQLERAPEQVPITPLRPRRRQGELLSFSPQDSIHLDRSFQFYQMTASADDEEYLLDTTLPLGGDGESNTDAFGSLVSPIHPQQLSPSFPGEGDPALSPVLQPLDFQGKTITPVDQTIAQSSNFHQSRSLTTQRQPIRHHETNNPYPQKLRTKLSAVSFRIPAARSAPMISTSERPKAKSMQRPMLRGTGVGEQVELGDEPRERLVLAAQIPLRDDLQIGQVAQKPRSVLRKSKSSMGFPLPAPLDSGVDKVGPTRWGDIVSASSTVDAFVPIPSSGIPPPSTRNRAISSVTSNTAVKPTTTTTKRSLPNPPSVANTSRGLLSGIPQSVSASSMLRPRPLSNMSSSSGSTTSSMRTFSSAMSSSVSSRSGGASPSVQSRIASLEAKARVPRGFSGSVTLPGKDLIGHGMTASRSSTLSARR